MPKCPECCGDKELMAAFVDYADGTSAMNVIYTCGFCKGTGQVEKWEPAWIAAGRLLRKSRVEAKPYRNLATEAKRRGVGVVTLSQMERGLIEPLPVIEQPTPGDTP